MTRMLLLGMLVLGTTGVALAQMGTSGKAPEIDPSQATTALALLTGASLIIRGRTKK